MTRKDDDINEVIDGNVVDGIDFESKEIKDALKKLGVEELECEGVPKIQRSFYVHEYIWKAAGSLPITRSEIITNALIEAVTAYKSKSVQLKHDIFQIDKQIEMLLAQRAAKVKMLVEIEKEETEDARRADLERIAVEQAVQETLTLAESFRKKMTKDHFKRLEVLSGVKASEIKEFLIKNDFSPDPDDLKLFYSR